MKKQITLYLMALLILSTLRITVTADVLPPSLEIKGVTFPAVLYAAQNYTLFIDIKNTGPGEAHNVTVELTSSLQDLVMPASPPVPTIPKESTKTVTILVWSGADLSNNAKAQISIRLIDKGHNQEFPFDKPWIREFKTQELELVLDQVKFENYKQPNSPIRRNDKIYLKFRVSNKSKVTARGIKVNVENNQKGVIWLGIKIGELRKIEDIEKKHPTFAELKPKDHKVVNYVYHLDREFNNSEVKFTLSGTVRGKKDPWMEKEYKNPVIVPFNGLHIWGWAGGIAIVGTIIGVVVVTEVRTWVLRWWREYGPVLLGLSLIVTSLLIIVGFATKISLIALIMICILIIINCVYC